MPQRSTAAAAAVAGSERVSGQHVLRLPVDMEEQASPQVGWWARCWRWQTVAVSRPAVLAPLAALLGWPAVIGVGIFVSPFFMGYVGLAVLAVSALIAVIPLLLCAVLAVWLLGRVCVSAVVWSVSCLRAARLWAIYFLRAGRAILGVAKPHTGNNLAVQLASGVLFLIAQTYVYLLSVSFFGLLPGNLVTSVLVLWVMINWLRVRLQPLQQSQPSPAGPDLLINLQARNQLWKLRISIMLFMFDAAAALVFALAVLNVSAEAIAIIAAVGFFLAFYMLCTGAVFMAPTYAQLYKLCAAACMDVLKHTDEPLVGTHGSSLMFGIHTTCRLQTQIRLWFPRVWGLEAKFFPYDPIVQEYRTPHEAPPEVILSKGFEQAFQTQPCWKIVPGWAILWLKACAAQTCFVVYHSTLNFQLLVCVVVLPLAVVIAVILIGTDTLKWYTHIMTSPSAYDGRQFGAAVAVTTAVVMAIGMVLLSQVIVTVLVWTLYKRVTTEVHENGWQRWKWATQVLSYLVPYCRIGRYAEGRLPDIWAWQQQQSLLGPHMPTPAVGAGGSAEVWDKEALNFIQQNCVGAWALIELYNFTECLRMYSLLVAGLLAVLLLTKGPSAVSLRVGLVVLSFGVNLLKSYRDKMKLLERAIVMWGCGGGLVKALEDLLPEVDESRQDILTYFNVLQRSAAAVDTVKRTVPQAVQGSADEVDAALVHQGHVGAIVGLFVNEGSKALVPEVYKTSFV